MRSWHHGRRQRDPNWDRNLERVEQFIAEMPSRRDILKFLVKAITVFIIVWFVVVEIWRLLEVARGLHVEPVAYLDWLPKLILSFFK